MRQGEAHDAGRLVIGRAGGRCDGLDAPAFVYRVRKLQLEFGNRVGPGAGAVIDLDGPHIAGPVRRHAGFEGQGQRLGAADIVEILDWQVVGLTAGARQRGVCRQVDAKIDP